MISEILFGNENIEQTRAIFKNLKIGKEGYKNNYAKAALKMDEINASKTISDKLYSLIKENKKIEISDFLELFFLEVYRPMVAAMVSLSSFLYQVSFR